MKNFKRILTVIFSCVLITCALAMVAACNVEKQEEGYFVGDKFISKNNKIIDNWSCSIPDDVEKIEGYEAVCKAQLYIII